MNRPLPSSEMSLKLRRSKTEDGLLSSRDVKSHLLSSRDESRDSAFFSLNNTSLCLNNTSNNTSLCLSPNNSLYLSPDLRQSEEPGHKIASSVYQQHDTNDLPKPLYLEVCSTESLLSVDILNAFFQVPSSPSTVKVKRDWVWKQLQESFANEKSRCLLPRYEY